MVEDFRRHELATVREEERRRLQRDLHDGLGPLLVASLLKLDTVDNLVDENPAAVHELLNDLRNQMQIALAEIRCIVYKLRPPSLDELGLVPALREFFDIHNLSNSLHIDFDAPEHLPPLSAMLEVAVYCIALEAITNVKRHADAQLCCVRLSVGETLCLEITDDGRGFLPGVRYGVGLIAMQERAAELGGTCQVEARSGQGTRVIAQLPC